MTILEAFKSRVKYPLDDNLLSSILIDRGVEEDDTYTKEVGISKEYQLCRADLLIAQIDTPQVQDNGTSINPTDKSNFITLANSIYEKYGEPQIGQKQPTVKYLDL